MGNKTKQQNMGNLVPTNWKGYNLYKYQFTGEEQPGDKIKVYTKVIKSQRDYEKEKPKLEGLFPGWSLTGIWRTETPYEVSTVEYRMNYVNNQDLYENINNINEQTITRPTNTQTNRNTSTTYRTTNTSNTYRTSYTSTSNTSTSFRISFGSNGVTQVIRSNGNQPVVVTNGNQRRVNQPEQPKVYNYVNKYEEIPSELTDERHVCPISQAIMCEPVITSCGHTFEEFYIREWLTKNNTCPTCKERINNTLTKNYALKGIIEDKYDKLLEN